jgi:ribonucleoside-diphosphate reductase alpha chain
VCKNIAGDDKANFKKFYALLDSGAFLPNSPTLMNAGNDLQQLSACFVLPIEDSLESIFSTIRDAALIHKSGGGTGFSFSRLREANSRVKTTSGVSSGPLSFLKVFNAATDAVKQGGTRRGANMAILSVNHPQILEFIKCKEVNTELTNFNISVGITQAFMDAVARDEEYDLISPYKNEFHSKLKAREVFSLIIEKAHKNGEPGLVFIDRINEYNPTPHIGMMESTNPCGEQPLLPYEACNLGSINVVALYRDGRIDWEYLKQIVRDSVDFLDNVIDKSKFPLPEIDEIVAANRKIGLGIMGWANLLFKMGIPYDSAKAIDLAEDLMEFIDYHGKERSMELAIEKGSFPNFRGSIYDQGTLKRTSKKQDWKTLIKNIKKNGIRNSTITTIAPTGTLSMICDTTGGIEPLFSLVFIKQVMDKEKLLYANEIFEAELRAADIFKGQPEADLLFHALMQKIADNGSIAHFSEVPDRIKKIFVASHDIEPLWHIQMQAAFQKYTDNAVSKTINFPNSATLQDIRTAYETAWKLGCKGITVYRDGSRSEQVMTAGNKTHEDKQVGDELRITPRLRPPITSGITQRLETSCGHLYVTVNTDDQGPCEIFTQIGKGGSCESAQLEAITRLCSMLLRANVTLESIVSQLKGIRCPKQRYSSGLTILSCADAIAKSLETFIAVKANGLINGSIYFTDISKINPTPPSRQYMFCPQCESVVDTSESCPRCTNSECGWTNCPTL